jgi:hypothetical protein
MQAFILLKALTSKSPVCKNCFCLTFLASTKFYCLYSIFKEKYFSVISENTDFLNLSIHLKSMYLLIQNYRTTKFFEDFL